MKKVLAYLLIIIGWVLLVADVFTLAGSLPRIFPGEIDAFSLGYMAGNFLAIAFIAFVGLRLIRFGKKLLKKEPDPNADAEWIETE